MFTLILAVSILRTYAVVAVPTANVEQIASRSSDTEIFTRLGRIHGIREASHPDGRQFLAFKGIPYVKPPVGDLRWKDPVPYGAWEGSVLNATTYRSMCPQFDMQMRSFVGNEDCLHLNVFTPVLPDQGDLKVLDEVRDNEVHSRSDGKQTPNTTSLPVMVWFHGGGYIQGSALEHDPAFLLRENIVLVTANYRLGALGFLSFGDKDLPGNYGMLDQVEALKWVRDNIAYFGGDPNRVTIFGESAGGSIAHLLSLSPLAAGLFHNVILQSGSALCSWSIEEDPLDYALQLAANVDCKHNSRDSMLECLRTKDPRDLVDASVNLLEEALFPIRTAPVVDHLSRDKPFLPDTPLNLIHSNRFKPVPMMSGVVRNEGVLFYAWILLENIFRLGRPGYVEQDLLPTVVAALLKNRTGLGAVVDSVKKRYFDGVLFTDMEAVFSRFSQVIDDSAFTSCVYQSQLLHADKSPVYAYVFDYRGEQAPSYSGPIFNLLRIFGLDYPLTKTAVSHADELLYLFKMSRTRGRYSQIDVKVSKLMTRLWANFAATGMPNDESGTFWSPVFGNSSEVPHFVISTSPKMASDFRREEHKFWTNEIPNVRNQAALLKSG